MRTVANIGLRHEVGEHLLRSGGDLDEIAALLSHRDFNKIVDAIDGTPTEIADVLARRVEITSDTRRYLQSDPAAGAMVAGTASTGLLRSIDDALLAGTITKGDVERLVAGWATKASNVSAETFTKHFESFIGHRTALQSRLAPEQFDAWLTAADNNTLNPTDFRDVAGVRSWDGVGAASDGIG